MKKLKYIIAISFSAIFLNSCTENFEDLNTPPNVITASKVDALLLGQSFAHAQYSALMGFGFQTSQSLFADLYSQYFGNVALNFDSDRHIQVGGWSNGAWGNFYRRMPSLKFVEDFSAENNLPIENAIAKIWRVEAFHRQSDYYGPIIYSQFGNGETKVPYDSQESIYRSFFCNPG